MTRDDSPDDQLRRDYAEQFTEPDKGPRLVKVKGQGGGVVLHPDDKFLTRGKKWRPAPVAKEKRATVKFTPWFEAGDGKNGAGK